MNGLSPEKSVTVLSVGANPRSTWSGSHGDASSYSPMQARAEHSGRAVHAEPLPDRAVDDDQWRRRVGRPRLAVEVEDGIARGLDDGEHHGKVVGAAAGHDRVDRDLLA